jgi:hypothetical protein
VRRLASIQIYTYDFLELHNCILVLGTIIFIKLAYSLSKSLKPKNSEAFISAFIIFSAILFTVHSGDVVLFLLKARIEEQDLGMYVLFFILSA